MPLYKKTTSKAKVKTQSSFISPLLNQASSQNKIKDLLKDYHKENFPIPTKKKGLESLINAASDEVDLFDKLQRKSFNESSKTLINVSKTKDTLSGKERDIPQKLKEGTPKFADLLSDVGWANKVNKEGSSKQFLNKSANFSTKRTKSKELSKTLSDLTSQSPLLFNPSPCSSLQKSNKRLKTENSMTITTKIEISSNTDGNNFNITNTHEMSNLKISDMLNDCVINNLRMSQQPLKPDEFSKKNSIKTTDDIHTLIDSKMEDKNELDSSLRDILDDVVNTNIVLSQKIMNDDKSIKDLETNVKKRKKTKKDKQGKNIQQKLETNKSKITANEKKKAEKSKQNIKTGNVYHSDDDLDASLRSVLDDVVNTNIMLSQEMDDTDSQIKKKKPNKEKGNKYIEPNKKKVKTKAQLKEIFGKSKYNIAVSKSKEVDESLSKSREVENKKSDDSIKTKSFKSIRGLSMLDDSSKKNKAKNTGRNNYLIEKQKPTKVTKEKGITKNTNLEKHKKNEKNMKPKDLNKEEKRFGAKKLKKTNLALSSSKSSYDVEEKKKASCPSKPRNMIFTSKNPKTIEMDLKKLLELQEERDVGLYVYCDTCDKVRYLPECKDPLDLPAKWYCYMNPDSNYDKCSDPDIEIEPEKEDIIIHNKYNAGSIVWAKMDGYPWWPAMVDDDPDLTDYFWLDEENSKEPSWYHVTFFDTSEVTRAWIKTANLAPFEINAKNPLFKPGRYDNYRYRVEAAVRDAKKAGKMGILERLRTHSFVARYFKKRNSTKKVQKESRSKKIGMAKNTSGNLVYNKKKDDINKQNNTNCRDITGTVDDTDEFCDNLSISSSEIISDILKPGKNKIASDEEILKNIDLNRFMSSVEAL